MDNIDYYQLNRCVSACQAAGGSSPTLLPLTPTVHPCGLRAVYRTLELPGKNPLKAAHDALDAAVTAAYGFDPKADLLAQILALNLEVARRESEGQPVTAPGVPPGFPDLARLVTDDCIRAE